MLFEGLLRIIFSKHILRNRYYSGREFVVRVLVFYKGPFRVLFIRPKHYCTWCSLGLSDIQHIDIDYIKSLSILNMLYLPNFNCTIGTYRNAYTSGMYSPIYQCGPI